jgi:integrase
MARTIQDSKLESRAARDRLAPGKKPHWRTLVPKKLHLGYRRKRKDEPGIWLVRHYLGNERYQIAPLGLADDYQDDGGVLSFADAQRAAHAHRPAVRGRAGLPTVGDALADYIADLRTERPASADHVQGIAARSILPALGAKRLAALTTEELTAWRNGLAEQSAYGAHRPPPQSEDKKRARRASANRFFGILRAALNKAFVTGLVASDTSWRRVKPLKKTTSARVTLLTHEQVRRLINAADAQSGFRNLVIAGLQTGMRYGELTRLRVGDFTNNKIHVRISKSGKPRFVTLTEEGVEFFRHVTMGRSADDLMFPKNGTGAWNKSNQADPMRAACSNARIEPSISFHQLRHVYASLSVMAGMPLPALARNLGHADTVMIEKHYGHLHRDYVDESIHKHAPRYGIVLPSNVTDLRKVLP